MPSGYSSLARSPTLWHRYLGGLDHAKYDCNNYVLQPPPKVDSDLSQCTRILKSPNLKKPDRAPSRIVVRNEIIQVKVGRRAFISPREHLTLNVENGLDCEVRVLQSPIEQTVGELNVDRFPCDFIENEIVYQHFGRSTPKGNF